MYHINYNLIHRLYGSYLNPDTEIDVSETGKINGRE